MQQPLPKQSQPNLPENRCPSCLSMQLEGIPVQPDQIDLYLTMNFDVQCESLPKGSISFGIKGGKLELRLENGRIHHQFRELTGSLALALHQKEQQANSYPVAKADAEPEQTEDTKEQVPLVTCQVKTKGSQKNPVWVFAVDPAKPVLQGLLKRAKLATLNVIATPCSVEATFDVSLQDIYLTRVQGLWSANMSTNQLAILERGIAQLLLKRKFQPYLSRIELHFDYLET
ncbi:MAG: hypothetical protein F6K47_05710 [Symploca sp. SIO2E6]|nr:hypothetical protein [Symploca sp. SIO2E6]